MKERRKTTCPLDEEHRLLMRVMFGDEQEGDIGMKKKVDAIYDMLVKLDGIGIFLKWLIIVGGVLAILKGWLLPLLK